MITQLCGFMFIYICPLVWLRMTEEGIESSELEVQVGVSCVC